MALPREFWIYLPFYFKGGFWTPPSIKGIIRVTCTPILVEIMCKYISLDTRHYLFPFWERSVKKICTEEIGIQRLRFSHSDPKTYDYIEFLVSRLSTHHVSDLAYHHFVHKATLNSRVALVIFVLVSLS
jgi:hypothetical protein